MIVVFGLPGASPAWSVALVVSTFLFPSFLGPELSLFLVVAVWWFYFKDAHQQTGAAGAEGNDAVHSPEPKKPTVEDIEKLVSRVMSFPIEEYCHPSMLSALPVKDIRFRLRHRSIDHENVIEKADLVRLLSDHHSAQQDACSICFETFCSTPLHGMCFPDGAAMCGGDGGASHVRVLPSCGHLFHIECIDRWAFSMPQNCTTRIRRLPTCPLCNAPL